MTLQEKDVGPRGRPLDPDTQILTPVKTQPSDPDIRAPSSVRTPRALTDFKHVTEFYERYEPQSHKKIDLPVSTSKRLSLPLFDKAPLYMELTSSTLSGEWDPPINLRLDDFNCAERPY